MFQKLLRPLQHATRQTNPGYAADGPNRLSKFNEVVARATTDLQYPLAMLGSEFGKGKLPHWTLRPLREHVVIRGDPVVERTRLLLCLVDGQDFPSVLRTLS